MTAQWWMTCRAMNEVPQRACDSCVAGQHMIRGSMVCVHKISQRLLFVYVTTIILMYTLFLIVCVVCRQVSYPDMETVSYIR